MKDYTFRINITGSGTADEIIKSLKEILEGIEHDKTPENLDGARWEDATLFTAINAE